MHMHPGKPVVAYALHMHMHPGKPVIALIEVEEKHSPITREQIREQVAYA